MLSVLRRAVLRTPILGPWVLKRRIQWQNESFRTSGEYWERRYRQGGTSGAGSYNLLAEFKAEFLNDFVAREEVGSVVELGCGDGSQLRLARYPRYTGIDVAPSAVAMCKAIFANDKTKDFRLSGELDGSFEAELAISLDVIYHLIEDEVFEGYMRELFARARRFVIVYSSNYDAAWDSKHVRHRKFTDWVEQNQPEWSLISRVPNRYPYDSENPKHTSFADFYVFARRSDCQDRSMHGAR